jgi:Zn-dependent peptidase ImmA (M78 family)
MDERRFKALIVATVLDMRPEAAIDMLSSHYRVERPRIRIGVIAGRNKGVRAVYSQARKEILAARREDFYDPFVLAHEFYHHLRSVSGKHRGTERQADEFALSFIEAYGRLRTAPEDTKT